MTVLRWHLFDYGCLSALAYHHGAIEQRAVMKHLKVAGLALQHAT